MTTPPGTYAVHDLGEVPSLASSYRTVLARAAQSVLTSPPGTLPEVALTAGPVTTNAGHLTAYQQLVGATVDDTLPPGYVHVRAFPLAVALMARADFPFSPLGMIHVANRIEQVRPVRLDEALTFTAWAHDAREHRRGTTVELSVTAAVRRDVSNRDSNAVGSEGAHSDQGEGGEIVWTGRSTYLSKGKIPAGLDRAPARGERQVPELPRQAQAVWTITSTDIHTYAQVSGDRNPIHTSRLGARAFGFPRTIAHGMYTAARALHAGTRPTSLSWDVEFGAPVLLPAKAAFAQVNTGSRQTDDSDTEPVEKSGSGDRPPSRRMVVWDPRRGKAHLTAWTGPLPT